MLPVAEGTSLTSSLHHAELLVASNLLLQTDMSSSFDRKLQLPVGKASRTRQGQPPAKAKDAFVVPRRWNGKAAAHVSEIDGAKVRGYPRRISAQT